jgi:hypothetical protein
VYVLANLLLVPCVTDISTVARRSKENDPVRVNGGDENGTAAS